MKHFRGVVLVEFDGFKPWCAFHAFAALFGRFSTDTSQSGTAWRLNYQGIRFKVLSSDIRQAYDAQEVQAVKGHHLSDRSSIFNKIYLLWFHFINNYCELSSFINQVCNASAWNEAKAYELRAEGHKFGWLSRQQDSVCILQHFIVVEANLPFWISWNLYWDE